MNRAGIVLFTAGALIAVTSVLLGNAMQEELRSIPVNALMRQHGPTSLKFLAFAYGFPLGIGISLLGALTSSEFGTRRYWFVLCAVLLATSSASLIPALWGRQLSALFFGNGGYIMMLLMLASIWYWGQYRARAPQSQHSAIDLLGIGYLCFAFAAWNICGAATMPSFALEPDMMLAMGSQAFAIGQMKAIMVLFILGWIFTLLGLRLAGMRK